MTSCVSSFPVGRNPIFFFGFCRFFSRLSPADDKSQPTVLSSSSFLYMLKYGRERRRVVYSTLKIMEKMEKKTHQKNKKISNEITFRDVVRVAVNCSAGGRNKKKERKEITITITKTCRDCPINNNRKHPHPHINFFLFSSYFFLVFLFLSPVKKVQQQHVNIVVRKTRPSGHWSAQLVLHYFPFFFFLLLELGMN